MRRILFSLLLTLPLAAAAQSAQQAQALLQRMTEAFRAMPAYEASFVLAAGSGEQLEGRFAVEGEHYYIALSDTEVFGTEELRYEVDHRRRETVIAPVERQTSNLLSDPPHAFEFVAAQYEAALAGEHTLQLRPTKRSEASIRLTLDPKTHLPASIRYEMSDAAIEVTIRSIGVLDGPLPRYDRRQTEGYELIDFR